MSADAKKLTTEDFRFREATDINIDMASFLETPVTVYFSDYSHLPIAGKFVQLKDHEELKKKKMVRFVPNRMIEDFDKKNRGSQFTKIFTYPAIKRFKV